MTDDKIAHAFGLDPKALNDGLLAPATEAAALVPAPPTAEPVAVATAEPKPAPPKAKAKKPKKRKAKKPKKRKAARIEQYDVIARQTGPHSDLKGAEGYITADYAQKRGGSPYNFTFDPSDESIPNSESGVVSWLQTDRTIAIRDDEGVTWRFEIADWEDDEEDWDDEDDHPFNE